jgi:hypothetical protein
MNRSPLNLTLSKSIDGFLNYKLAKGLTQRSVSSYEWVLRKWVEQRGDHLLTEVTSDDVRNYLAWLRTDYQPHRYNHKTHPLSPKTLRNIWVTLSAFFGWAHTEFQLADPMDDIPAPRFQKTPVEPFTKEEVDKLLKACLYSREAKTMTRRAFVMRPPTPCATRPSCWCCWIPACALLPGDRHAHPVHPGRVNHPAGHCAYRHCGGATSWVRSAGLCHGRRPGHLHLFPDADGASGECTGDGARRLPPPRLPTAGLATGAGHCCFDSLVASLPVSSGQVVAPSLCARYAHNLYALTSACR